MFEIEGEFIDGNYVVKVVENEDLIIFILEDMLGKDFRELGIVFYIKIMFVIIDSR